MALQDVFDPAVEPLEHAICLWPHLWREAMLDAEIGAELVELMLPVAALAQAEQAVGESLAVVGQYPGDVQWRCMRRSWFFRRRVGAYGDVLGHPVGRAARGQQDWTDPVCGAGVLPMEATVILANEVTDIAQFHHGDGIVFKIVHPFLAKVFEPHKGTEGVHPRAPRA